MTPIEMLKPWRIIASFIPGLYASLLILELDNSWVWGLLAIVALAALLWLFSSMGFPLPIMLPVFAVAFLLLACLFVLYTGLPSYGLIPATHSPAEVYGALALALLYIGWGALTARRAMYGV